MANKKMSTVGARVALLLIVMVATAAADTISITTSGQTWYLTNIGSTTFTTPGVAASVVGNGISLTSTSYCTMVGGVCSQTSGVAGGATFDGYWVAYTTFTLPAGYTNASLTINSIYTDDRAVLELNPTGFSSSSFTLSNSNVVADAAWSTGSGTMYFTDGSATTGVAFNAQNNTVSTAIASEFVAGTNYLVLILNNTGSTNISAALAGFANAGDQAVASLNATVSYTPAASGVPEPSSISYFLIGFAPLLLRFVKRPSR
jgi:hypothetical protein